MLATTFWSPIRCAARAVRPTPSSARHAEPDAPGDAVARHRLRRRAGRAREAGLGGRRGPPSIGASPALRARRVPLVARLRRVLGLLVDLLDLLGDARPRVARRRFARRAAHRLAAGRLEVDPLELLGQPLRVGRGHQHAVGAVGDHVGVARDLRCDHRRAGRERLGQHHAEALARRATARRARRPRGGGARAPRRRPGPRRRSATRSRDRQRSAARRRGSAPITVSRAGTCSTSPSNACSRTGSPLRSSGLPTNSSLSSSERGFGSDGRRVDVDAVGDDAVLAAEPAPPGPGGGLGDGDPRVELVELAARAEQVGDRVGHPLGRVGVEGADHRARRGTSTRPSASIGAGGSCTWTTSKRPACSSRRILSTAPGKDGQVGDRAVGADTRRCARAGSGSRGGFAARPARGGARG